MIGPRRRVSVFNQAPGPLLTDFVAALSAADLTCTLFTGGDIVLTRGMRLKRMPVLNRTSGRGRILSWLAYSFVAALHLVRCNADERVILFSNPPVVFVFAWLCSRVRRFRYSAVVYDIYPDVITAMGLAANQGLAVRAWRSLNRRAYNSAYAVVTLGDVMASELARQFDPACTPARHIAVSRPWVNTALITPGNKPTAFLTVLCSGNTGVTHDMETIAGAARLLASQTELRFVIIGAGSAFEAVERTFRDLRNVRVLSWQPEEQLSALWGSADIAIVTLRSGLERWSFPSRTAYALSAGCALIGVTEEPSDLAQIIANTGCGLIVKPGDSRALAGSLIALMNDTDRLKTLQMRARKAAEELFTREKNISVLLNALPPA